MLLFHTSLHTRRAVKGGGNVYHLPFPCPELQPRCQDRQDQQLHPRALRPFLSTLSGVARGSLQAGADASRAVGLQFALSPVKHAALIEALGDGREHAVRFVPDAVSRWSTLRDGLVADACRDGFGDAAVGLDGSLDVLVQVAHVGLRGTLELLGDGGEGGEGGAGGDPRPRKHEDMRLILGGDWLKSADAAALGTTDEDTDFMTINMSALIRALDNLARSSSCSASDGFLASSVGLLAAASSLVLAPALAPATEDAPYPSGPAVLVLVFAYSLWIWAGTSPRWKASACRAELRRQWAFCATLSVFMVMPDWFLAVVVKTLRFPDDGAPRIGGENGVGMYMTMMWTLPLLWVLAACSGVGEGTYRGAVTVTSTGKTTMSTPPPSFAALALAAFLALLLFGAAELLLSSGLIPLTLWHCTDAVRLRPAGVALYVLPAEAVLGAATLQAYASSRRRGWVRRVVYAAAVSALYTGTLALGYLFVEAGARP